MYALTQILAGLAALGITGAASAGAAYWLFQTFAKGWLQSHFDRDLEAFRAANTREAERLKADLSRYADRATKFHTREYEVLPEAWGLMNKAYSASSGAISSFQQHADINCMTKPHLEDWLEGSGLPKFQQDEIRNSADKNRQYSKIFTWRQISDAQKATAEFGNYVILQGVFIDEEISTKMTEAARVMRMALISRTMVERIQGGPAPGQTDFWEKALEEISPVEGMVEQVKFLVRQRLSDIKLAAESA
jgi:hypothetical protein